MTSHWFKDINDVILSQLVPQRLYPSFNKAISLCSFFNSLIFELRLSPSKLNLINKKLHYHVHAVVLQL